MDESPLDTVIGDVVTDDVVRARSDACKPEKPYGNLFVPGEGIFSMAKKLYVGNLSYNTTEDGLRNLFSGFGTVASSKIIFDRESGNSKGFGFIEMGSEEEANAAIAGTNGREFDGRQLRVNEAMDKPRRERGGGNW